ncbi:hypothetical protein KPH14_001062 [Odynerus spinipes]|uniref:Uncharacterized protein n=1 Tax=Odynerus spinipes TaxID=1348599 RepID=A0AAD9REV3_9HYME|nr:hypothetical protein KPH14_001062 [Odynerus spinipes]
MEFLVYFFVLYRPCSGNRFNQASYCAHCIRGQFEWSIRLFTNVYFKFLVDKSKMLDSIFGGFAGHINHTREFPSEPRQLFINGHCIRKKTRFRYHQ